MCIFYLSHRRNIMKLQVNNKGFTLVEIAIVLVIVGLLIGGVLKGQEMITNAKLKRIESDNAGIAAAMFSYQDRYLQLPGDDSAASTRFDVTTAVGNGDGNGVIGGDWDSSVTTDESSLFWSHVRAAGLVAGNPNDATRPTNAYGGKIGVQDGFGGTGAGIAGHVTVFGQIEGPIAKILEARLDDGKPNSGRMQGMVTGSSAAITAYFDSSRYNLGFRL
jgi:prepilin-type N-terminal cleavage/methylation domain-containing protein